MPKSRFRIERRAPKQGELGWWVFPDWTMAEIRADVLTGADPELGWLAQTDAPFIDPIDGLQSVTIVVLP